MRSFIVKLKNFFKLNTTEPENFNFKADKRQLIIPLYQREYKWSDEKIKSLINDVERRDKFLGNVILDEAQNCYEIVDGQQRIATCYLTLLCLYNYYKGNKLEQEHIKALIKPYNDCFLLKNESIGNYILESEGNMTLSIPIDENVDIYFQKNDFERAYKTISNAISSIGDLAAVREFKRNLLDCEILVLINDVHANTRPIEQVFLDINEKAQLLEVEDIFKGHCFENYEEEYHLGLRNIWTNLKKCGMGFTKFGFENVSKYLYLYLLEKENSTIPENLTPAGKHFLEGKTMDETGAILTQMIAYGVSVLAFYSKLYQEDYRFIDLCFNSNEYRNTDDHKTLKRMCIEMLEPKGKAQYQKLPLMYLIYSISNDEGLANSITHIDFRRIITNLYVYMTLFVFSGAKKSKNDVDHSIRNAITSIPFQASELVIAAKALRTNKVEGFSVQQNFNYDKLSFIYSILDNYSANDNWLKEKYAQENNFNLEHFLIPDNKLRKIKWVDSDNSFELILPLDFVRNFRKKTINFLITNKELNGLLEHDDVLTKVNTIKTWYNQRNNNIPIHINLFIEFIEKMQEYIDLIELKGIGANHQQIEEKYLLFLEKYFKDETQSLLKNIENAFIAAFRND